ncbi:MAG: family 16 glycoside hydrolase [Syntrophomonadaceae bacterium]
MKGKLTFVLIMCMLITLFSTGCSSQKEEKKQSDALSTLIDVYNHKEEDKTQPEKIKGKEVQGNVYYEDFTQSVSDNWNRGEFILTNDPEKGLSIAHREHKSHYNGRVFMKNSQYAVQNYIVEADLALNKDFEHNEAGFVFSYNEDPENDITYYDKVILDRFENASGKVTMSIQNRDSLKEVSYTPGEYAHLKVEVRHDKFKVFFNDNFIFEFAAKQGNSRYPMKTNEHFRPGLWWGDNNSAYFKNFKVTII